MSVLVHVVEDDDGARDSLVFLLRTADYDVEAFPSALDYLAASRAAQPACIVTDLRMPGAGGLEMIRHLRRSGNSVPVIVITGHGGTYLAEEAIRSGAVDLLEKPFDHERLLAVVASAVASGN